DRASQRDANEGVAERARQTVIAIEHADLLQWTRREVAPGVVIPFLQYDHTSASLCQLRSDYGTACAGTDDSDGGVLHQLAGRIFRAHDHDAASGRGTRSNGCE